MALLSERDRREVQAQLKALTGPVGLVNFTQELACQYCRETEQLLHELKDLSDKISLEVNNFQLHVEASEFPHLAQRYQVRAVPRSIVNETAAIEGALPEISFLEAAVQPARTHDGFGTHLHLNVPPATPTADQDHRAAASCAVGRAEFMEGCTSDRGFILFEAQALLPYPCNSSHLPAGPVCRVIQRR